MALELIEGYGMSAREVAAKMEVSKRTVNRWLAGERRARAIP